MAIKHFKPTSPGRRQRTALISQKLAKDRPLKSLTVALKGAVGRSRGQVTIRHRSVGAKKLYRQIDFRRDKRDIEAKVARLEYDPNRGGSIALLTYIDGEKRYILAPEGLNVGDRVVAGENVEIREGNALPLGSIPIGIPVHNLELMPGRGGQLVRGAGTAARITAKEGDYVQVQMPSGEIRKLQKRCFATVGQVSNPETKTIKIGKAGRKRHLGVRPTVRGVAMHPAAHPHGGGEGRSGVGMKSPKSPWGKRTLGKKTRRRTHTNRFIIRRRR